MNYYNQFPISFFHVFAHKLFPILSLMKFMTNKNILKLKLQMHFPLLISPSNQHHQHNPILHISINQSIRIQNKHIKARQRKRSFIYQQLKSRLNSKNMTLHMKCKYLGLEIEFLADWPYS